MKRIVSLALSLVLAIGLITPLSFGEVLEKPGVGVVKVLGAEEEYTFTTVEGTSTKNYFPEYDLTINVFGRDGCYNTTSVISKIIALGIDKMHGVKVNFIDIDKKSKETIKAFSEQFESSAIDYCYDTSNNANRVMWDYAYTIGSGGSVTLPVVAFVNSDSTIRKVTTGTLTDYYLMGIVNNDENIDKTLALKIKGVNNYDYANSVLQQMNELRNSLGLNELIMDEELLSVAMQRAAEISIYYSHTRPDDSSCFSFSVSGRTFGENIAIGYTSPGAVMNGWTNSSGHYANMIDSDFNAVGVGCFEASDGTLCWVQFFTGGATPNKAEKSGSVNTTHTVKAKNKNLDLSITSSKYDLSTAKKDDAITFGVINRNIEFGYQTQDVSDSFNFKSLDSDVIEINNDGVGKVAGEGTVEIKATLKDDVQFSLENKITIGHNHTYSHYYSNNDATCASDGTKTAYCDYPSCTETDTVKEYGTRLEHSYIWTTLKKATVYSEGKKQKECSVCGEILTTATIPQLKCSKPTLKAVTNSQYGVKITWSKVKGGDSYRVYRKTKNSSWKYLDSTKNGYFTDKTAKSGTKYYYAVRARNEADNSALSSTKSIYYLADPTLKSIANTEYGVKITWGKVSGAEKYSVYRKVSGGKYKYIGATSKNYYTDKTAKSGTKYYYAIRAKKGETVSALSSSLSKYYLADPTLKTPSSTKSGITLKWTKVTGAQGYIIYRKTGSGSYTKIKTEKGVSNLSYTDKTAKKGKKYTYKIKAYKSKTYSAYSNTKTITDKY